MAQPIDAVYTWVDGDDVSFRADMKRRVSARRVGDNTAAAPWRLTHRLATSGEKAGWVAGIIQYPVERVLTTFIKESPTTEIAVCRRRDP